MSVTFDGELLPSYDQLVSSDGVPFSPDRKPVPSGEELVFPDALPVTPHDDAVPSVDQLVSPDGDGEPVPSDDELLTVCLLYLAASPCLLVTS